MSNAKVKEGFSSSDEACRGRVLLVDDDANVLDVISSMLMMMDVEVDAFADCHEAIAHYHQTSQQYEVVILDMLMTDMTGIELLASLREHRPDQKAIFCSGYGEDTALADGAKPVQTSFLQKPFTIDGLQQIVDEFLPVPV